MAANTTKQVVLIVDDMPENLDVLREILLPDYTIKAATNGEKALEVVRNSKPDIILLDIMMPGMSGYDVCRTLKSNPETMNIPVIFVTAMSEVTDQELGFDVGAIDYLTKPVIPAIVRARVRNHLILANQQRATEQLVKIRTHELEQSQRSAVFMLGDAGHYNDTDTGVHIWRMAAYSAALARASGWSVRQAGLLELAASMHDTGKIGIPDSILKAPRKLTEEEMAIMKNHADIGYQILSKSETALFQLAAEIALSHHEKWNGSGYPQELSGADIPESARIVAIADVFDALTMKRPYKQAWSVEDAFDTLVEDAGSHFDPRLVNLFLQIKDEIMAIRDEWSRHPLAILDD